MNQIFAKSVVAFMLIIEVVCSQGCAQSQFITGENLKSWSEDPVPTPTPLPVPEPPPIPKCQRTQDPQPGQRFKFSCSGSMKFSASEVFFSHLYERVDNASSFDFRVDFDVVYGDASHGGMMTYDFKNSAGKAINSSTIPWEAKTVKSSNDLTLNFGTLFFPTGGGFFSGNLSLPVDQKSCLAEISLLLLQSKSEPAAISTPHLTFSSEVKCTPLN